MGVCFTACVLWLLVLSTRAEASADDIQAECLGNRVQFSIHSLLSAGGPVEVYAVNDSQTVLLTPHLATQCGYTQKSDPWGNTIVSASLQSCLADNKGDAEFKVAMKFKLLEFPTLSAKVYEVAKTCSHAMTSREILCEPNFMEVSVRNAIPEFKTAMQKQMSTVIPNLQLWKIILYTPAEKTFQKQDLQKMGYNVQSSPTRLVMRSPYNTAENFIQQVDDVDMMVFKSVVLYRDRWMMTIVESAAACPTNGASIVGEEIVWRMPHHITPLASPEVEILEIHFGVNGRILSRAEMESRNYVMTLTETHVIVQIPIGALDGYFKSHAFEEQYHISYTIEPMLELVWKEGADKTTYKVLFPITTPLTPWPLHVTDQTQPELKMFDVLLGSFLPDVELLNITFGSETLTVSEMTPKRFGLQQHDFPNGTKAFALLVPFSDPSVQTKNLRPDERTYTLPLVFGFVILPERESFSYLTVLESSIKDLELSSVGGTCDQNLFKVHVKYGSIPVSQLRIKLGRKVLNEETLLQYEHNFNETHLNISVPFLAPLVSYESVHVSGLGGRLDVQVHDALNEWHLKNFSLACPFTVKLAECFPNGTVTLALPKLDSSPHLIAEKLSLRDSSCRPYFTQGQFAYFRFAVSTCGTTRKFVGDTMRYENEVIWETNVSLPQSTSKSTYADYGFKVSCIYTANATQSVLFHAVPPKEPALDLANGDLSVRLRLSQDMVYKLFYHKDDYPVLKYLTQPLYFEVGLDNTADSKAVVVLQNCWATLSKERESKPKWDLVVDGCSNPKSPDRTIILPVTADERDVPDHFKRFEVKTSAFSDVAGSLENNEDVGVARQMFVHCDVVLCHAENAADDRCYKKCAKHPNSVESDLNRVRRDSDFSQNAVQHVSAGPILFI